MNKRGYALILDTTYWYLQTVPEIPVVFSRNKESFAVARRKFSLLLLDINMENPAIILAGLNDGRNTTAYNLIWGPIGKMRLGITVPLGTDIAALVVTRGNLLGVICLLRL